MREQAHKDAIERAIEHWNAHDERYYELYTDDAPIHGFPGVPETVEGMRGLFQQIWTSFPDIRADPLRIAAEGDLLAAHLRLTGTHEGEFLGAAPSGNQVEVEVMSFWRFGPEGKVVERWTRIDEVALLTQLGLMPAPAAAPA